MDLLVMSTMEVIAANVNIISFGSFRLVLNLIIGMSSIFSLASLFFIGKIGYELFRKKRVFISKGLHGISRFVFSLVVILTIGITLYYGPEIFLGETTWNLLKDKHLHRILMAFYSIISSIVLFYILFISEYFSQKSHNKPIYTVTIFSLVSGGAYAFVMFIVNTALANPNRMKLIMGGYFVLGLVLYVFCQKQVRKQLTILTNNLIFSKRVDLLDKIAKTPYYKLEAIGNEKIYTILNNDTETISNSVSLIVIGITSSVTILTSFVYLGVSNIYALLTSVFFVIIAGITLVLVNKSAEKLFDKTRDSQNNFFRFINDLVSGFKELCLNKERRKEFQDDMVNSCDTYREKRIEAELVGANVYFVGELLAFIILGGLIFLLPTVYKAISNAVLSDYVVVFLFLKGPIDNVLNMIPRISQVKVSWRRIDQIEKQITMMESPHMDNDENLPKKVTLSLEAVEYKYKDKAGESFSVGPLNCKFTSGEVIFITGGNGSGKSTLAKLITGLYTPDKGFISINKKKIETENLGQFFSTVFSDYHLFEKMYGIDYDKEKKRVEKYLEVLRIKDKVQIKEGIFSTTKLSTGQKKRLALLISYIDDRPIYLFDEWAADQDPEFREFFYEILIPDMKKQGKCVIAITHDDRYFNIADKLIKLETGKIVNEKEKESALVCDFTA